MLKLHLSSLFIWPIQAEYYLTPQLCYGLKREAGYWFAERTGLISYCFNVIHVPGVKRPHVGASIAVILWSLVEDLVLVRRLVQ